MNLFLELYSKKIDHHVEIKIGHKMKFSFIL